MGRKAMQKLGLKPVHGITRVTIKKPKQILLYIDDPQVMKNPGTDSYVVFGDAKFSDFSQTPSLSQAAENIMAEEGQGETVIEEDVKEEENGDNEDGGDGENDGGDGGEDKGDDAPAEDAGEGVQESDLKEEDIEIVMSHVNCTREEAVKELIKAG